MAPALALLVRLQVPIGVLLVAIASFVPGLSVVAQGALYAVSAWLGVPRPSELAKRLSEARSALQAEIPSKASDTPTQVD